MHHVIPHLSYLAKMAIVECENCPTFHTQPFDCCEYTIWVLGVLTAKHLIYKPQLLYLMTIALNCYKVAQFTTAHFDTIKLLLRKVNNHAAVLSRDLQSSWGHCVKGKETDEFISDSASYWWYRQDQNVDLGLVSINLWKTPVPWVPMKTQKGYSSYHNTIHTMD